MMNVIDRFILERLTDMATVGLYNFGYRLAAIMTLFVRH
jgi:O-antigen/teichoic acid export membrane protein